MVELALSLAHPDVDGVGTEYHIQVHSRKASSLGRLTDVVADAGIDIVALHQTIP